MRSVTSIRNFIGLLFIALLSIPAWSALAGDVEVHENIAYKSGGSLTEYERTRCKLDLYVPADKTNFPVMVWFHGGNITAGDKAQEIQVGIARSLAARGIAVAAVNYRLSPQVKFPAYIDDAAASVAWALEHIKNYRGDSSKVFVAGHSAGGYLAAMVGIDDQYLAAYGHRLDELAGLIPISGQMVTHATIRKERGLPEDRPIVDAAAPVFHARADAPRWLAIAGSDDLPARSEENRYFIAALKAVKHPDATFMEFEGRNHGTIVTGIPEDTDPVAQAIVEFIMGGR